MKNNGETRINLQYALFRKGTELLYGDIVKKANGTEEVVGTYFDYVPIEGDKIMTATDIFTPEAITAIVGLVFLSTLPLIYKKVKEYI